MSFSSKKKTATAATEKTEAAAAATVDATSDVFCLIAAAAEADTVAREIAQAAAKAAEKAEEDARYEADDAAKLAARRKRTAFMDMLLISRKARRKRTALVNILKCNKLHPQKEYDYLLDLATEQAEAEGVSDHVHKRMIECIMCEINGDEMEVAATSFKAETSFKAAVHRWQYGVHDWGCTSLDYSEEVTRYKAADEDCMEAYRIWYHHVAAELGRKEQDGREQGKEQDHNI